MCFFQHINRSISSDVLPKFLQVQIRHAVRTVTLSKSEIKQTTRHQFLLMQLLLLFVNDAFRGSLVEDPTFAWNRRQYHLCYVIVNVLDFFSTAEAALQDKAIWELHADARSRETGLIPDLVQLNLSLVTESFPFLVLPYDSLNWAYIVLFLILWLYFSKSLRHAFLPTSINLHIIVRSLLLAMKSWMAAGKSCFSCSIDLLVFHFFKLYCFLLLFEDLRLLVVYGWFSFNFAFKGLKAISLNLLDLILLKL